MSAAVSGCGEPFLGFSREKLGQTLDLTFQQIQKYERGANLIGASRLYQLSQILDVPTQFFFDDMPESVQDGMAEPSQEPYERDPLVKRETLELVRAHHRIPNARAGNWLFELTKAMAKSASAGYT